MADSVGAANTQKALVCVMGRGEGGAGSDLDLTRLCGPISSNN
jgi:hypothetical protein